MLIAETQIDDSDAAFDLNSDPRWHVVKTVIASPLFAKSERLSGFLLFVCKLSLEGKDEEINEQAIGSNIFERPENYDAANDNIVRIHASRLRLRLKEYFARPEATDSPFVIEIPKGAYVPVFIPRQVEAQDQRPENFSQSDINVPSSGPATVKDDIPSSFSKETSQDMAEGRGRKIGRVTVRVLLVICVLWSMATSIYLLSHPHKLKQIDAIVVGSRNPLWNRLFRTDKQTLVVTADSSLVLLQNLSGNRITLAQYVEGGYSEKLSEHASMPSSILQNLASRRYTSVVDLNTVEKLSRIPGIDLSNTQVRYSRDLHPNELKDGNVVLLGTYESTPWVQMFEPRMNFYFINDLRSPYFALMNRHPKDGEQAQYTYDSKDPDHTVYGVVAFQPTMSGSGDALILEGQTMAGTEAATDFVFDDTYLLPFVKQIKRPDGSLPHFEVLIASKGLNGDASRLQVVAYRVE